MTVTRSDLSLRSIGALQSRCLSLLARLKYLSFREPFDCVVVLLVGLVILFLSYNVGFPHLSHPDEIQYAIMGRNIANGYGFVTNVYNPLVIVEHGYPKGDWHIAGYMVILAISYLLLGQSEYAALLPNQVAYIASGVLLYLMGKWLLNKRVGFVAALFFFLYPGNFMLASTFMAEPPAVLFSALFLFLWVRSVVSPHWVLAPLMALTIVLGMTQRETIFALILPALYALWIWPRDAGKGKACLTFFLALLLSLLFIFFPLNSIRGVYKYALPLAPFAEGLNPLKINYPLLFSRFIDNLRSLSKFDGKAEDFGVLWEFFLVVIAALAFLRSGKHSMQRQIAGYFLVTFVAGFIVLGVIHKIANRTGLRMLLFTMPPAFLTLSMVISQIRQEKLKNAVLVALTLLSLFIAVQVGAELGERREEDHLYQVRLSNILARYLEPVDPDRVIVPGRTHLYAWRYYPVEVFRFASLDYTQYQIVRERVAEKVGKQYPFDAIVVHGQEKAEVLNAAIDSGLLQGKYRMLDDTAVTQLYFFLRRE